MLDALGYRVLSPVGADVRHICDHEPTQATRAAEESPFGQSSGALRRALSHIKEQTFGHGSIEHAGIMAREHPDKADPRRTHKPALQRRRSPPIPNTARTRHPNLRIAIETKATLGMETASIADQVRGVKRPIGKPGGGEDRELKRVHPVGSLHFRKRMGTGFARRQKIARNSSLAEWLIMRVRLSCGASFSIRKT